MGGRGASSGISDKGKKYGTEYNTLLQSGNIKFVRNADGSSTSTPIETMTKGRVYVTVNKDNKLKSITYYDKNNKRFKQVDLTHQHEGLMQHTHKGYFHDEKGTRDINEKEKKMIERIYKIWYYHQNSRN